MSNNKNKLVIFDFDGVLVDTLQLWHTLNLVTNPDMKFEDFAKMSHGNFYNSIETTSQFIPNPNAHREYQARITEFETPFEVQEAIKYFSPTHLIAVVSSGVEEAIKSLLEKEDLLPYFDDILGFETHKLKTVKLDSLLKKYNLPPHDAVFVTDTLGDILEANEVGIRSIGVTWGLHEREILEKGNPAAVIDNPANLQETIETLLSS